MQLGCFWLIQISFPFDGKVNKLNVTAPVLDIDSENMFVLYNKSSKGSHKFEFLSVSVKEFLQFQFIQINEVLLDKSKFTYLTLNSIKTF